MRRSFSSRLFCLSEEDWSPSPQRNSKEAGVGVSHHSSAENSSRFPHMSGLLRNCNLYTKTDCNYCGCAFCNSGGSGRILIQCSSHAALNPDTEVAEISVGEQISPENKTIFRLWEITETLNLCMDTYCTSSLCLSFFFSLSLCRILNSH